jgi:hypothetical protein
MSLEHDEEGAWGPSQTGALSHILRERERERESVWKEKKKREDSFLFPFLSFFLLF